MRTTTTKRAEGRADKTQTDLWGDGLSGPAAGESRGERVRRIADDAILKLAEALAEGRSEALSAYLGAMSRFHRYSLHNVLLIAAQRPDATHVAGFRKWLELERAVRKGEKGIAIFAPMIRKARGDTSAEAGEEPEEPGQVRAVQRFRVVYVFDVSQTEGKPLPEFAKVKGEPGERLSLLRELTNSRGISLEFAPDLGGAQGASSGGVIHLLEGLPPAEEFAVLAHELAHEILHHDPNGERPESRTVRETEAEAVAFVVTSACGLETGTAARDYIQLYRGDKDALQASLQRIQSAASTILAAVLPESP